MLKRLTSKIFSNEQARKYAIERTSATSKRLTIIYLKALLGLCLYIGLIFSLMYFVGVDNILLYVSKKGLELYLGLWFYGMLFLMGFVFILHPFIICIEFFYMYTKYQKIV